MVVLFEQRKQRRAITVGTALEQNPPYLKAPGRPIRPSDGCKMDHEHGKLSPAKHLTSQLFSEAECPPKGQKKRPFSGVGGRVYGHLYGQFPNVQQPKTIAREAKAPYEGAKKWLNRNEGVWVVDTGAGWYRARATVQLMRNLGFSPIQAHGIQVLIKSRDGGLPPRLEGHVWSRADGTGKGEWRERPLTVQATADGALVSIRASMKPFSVAEFCELAAWLEGCANGGEVLVKNIEFNSDADHHVVRIAGAGALSVGAVREAMVKAYNKRVTGVLRFEACFHRLDAPLSEILRVLNEFATPPSSYVPPLTPADGWEVA